MRDAFFAELCKPVNADGGGNAQFDSKVAEGVGELVGIVDSDDGRTLLSEQTLDILVHKSPTQMHDNIMFAGGSPSEYSA